MGSSKQSVQENTNQNSSQNVNQSSGETYYKNDGAQSSINFKPRSAQEAQLLNQIQGLGNEQNHFLSQLINGQSSPFQLTPQDQAQLDAAYGGAMNRFQTEGKDYADYLATTRGLNKSDTPVSQQAMERYGLGMSDLLSQKANQGLNMGLQGTGLRLQGAGSLPAGLGSAFNALYNERLAAPQTTMTSSGSGSSNSTFNSNMFGNQNGTSMTTQRYTPSLMQQIGQGMSLASQGIGLGAQIGGMAMSPMGGLGAAGMGSGAAANSWFGPTQMGGMGSFFQK
jgi:hypothetical protein